MLFYQFLGCLENCADFAILKNHTLAASISIAISNIIFTGTGQSISSVDL